MTLACITSAIGVLSLFLCLLRGTNPNPSYIRVIKVIPFGSLLLAIIGTATGIVLVTGQSLAISVAAILAIIGILANVGAAVMTVKIPTDYY
jgi:hypothetical protein